MVKQQESGTAIVANFAPPYACIFMNSVETEFLEKEHLKPWVWLRYFNDIFFVWTHRKDQLYKFLEQLTQREKCADTEFFLVSPNTGKYGPEKTRYLDIFHAV